MKQYYDINKRLIKDGDVVFFKQHGIDCVGQIRKYWSSIYINFYLFINNELTASQISLVEEKEWGKLVVTNIEII